MLTPCELHLQCIKLILPGCSLYEPAYIILHADLIFLLFIYMREYERILAVCFMKFGVSQTIVYKKYDFSL